LYFCTLEILPLFIAYYYVSKEFHWYIFEFWFNLLNIGY
jgi:hypothetical protein